MNHLRTSSAALRGTPSLDVASACPAGAATLRRSN